MWPLFLLKEMGRDSEGDMLWSPCAHLAAQEWRTILQTGITLGKVEKTSRTSIL